MRHLFLVGLLGGLAATCGSAFARDGVTPPAPTTVAEPVAERRPVRGLVILDCRVGYNGLASDCKVVVENPPGRGLGEIALVTASSVRHRVSLNNGKPVGGRTLMPINFADVEEALSGAARGPSVSWKAAPSFADMAAAWPEAAGDAPQGKVGLSCRVTDAGGLSLCSVLSEEPRGRGFAAAAQTLMPLFEPASPPQKRSVMDTISVSLMLTFVNPKTPGDRVVAHPNWIVRPTDRELETLPAEAVAKGLRGGIGIVDCAVKVDGGLADCRPEREDPVGAGFGAAAARLAEDMRMSVWTGDGRPVDGARVRVPIRFQGPDGVAPLAEAPPAN